MAGSTWDHEIKQLRRNAGLRAVAPACLGTHLAAGKVDPHVDLGALVGRAAHQVRGGRPARPHDVPGDRVALKEAPGGALHRGHFAQGELAQEVLGAVIHAHAEVRTLDLDPRVLGRYQGLRERGRRRRVSRRT